jgi:trk system potassium uptake protein
MHIIIVGCGGLGSSLAIEFSNQGHDVVVVDNVHENFDKLRGDFYGRIIRCSDIDDCVLLKAGIERADTFLALTQDDNINITTCQIARNIYDVKTVIAENVDSSREFIYSKLGIEYISTIRLAANTIKNKVS